tara:strand:+ start:371 stop:517 length:147 start_codon:yes stop_codon:yes gene_type:complete
MEKGHDNKMFKDEREKERTKGLDFQGHTGMKEGDDMAEDFSGINYDDY